MARVVSVATAVPMHQVGAQAMRDYLSQYLEPGVAQRCVRMMDGSRIRKRHVSLPVEVLMRPRDLGERSEDYRREAIRMSEEVVRRALAAAALDPGAPGLAVAEAVGDPMQPALSLLALEVSRFGPVVLGGGKRLLPQGVHARFKLTRSAVTYPSGVVGLHYERVR